MPTERQRHVQRPERLGRMNGCFFHPRCLEFSRPMLGWVGGRQHSPWLCRPPSHCMRSRYYYSAVFALSGYLKIVARVRKMFQTEIIVFRDQCRLMVSPPCFSCTIFLGKEYMCCWHVPRLLVLLMHFTRGPKQKCCGVRFLEWAVDGSWCLYHFYTGSLYNLSLIHI